MHKRTIGDRILEIIPGGLSYLVLLLPIILSLFLPAALVVFIICYDFYWLIRSLFMGVYLISAYYHMNYENNIDWQERLENLSDISDLIRKTRKRLKNASFFEKRKLSEELRLLLHLRNNPTKQIDYRELYHAVIFTTYKEPYEVLHKSISAVADSDYPNDKIILILATEARSGNEGQEIAHELKKDFEDVFAKFLITIHPAEIERELKGKGSNAYWAGQKLKKLINEMNVDYEKVMVSIFDADTRPSYSYFSSLTYKYLLHTDRTYHSYQPIPLYSNNIWQVPPVIRIVAFGSSFWQLIESTRPYRLINFSSQSLSLKTLVDIDFWDRFIVSEDSRTYYRAFFRYHGKHSCVPLFNPVYMDAIYADTLWQTLKNQYLQKRRWAWGVEHFPYLVKEALTHKEIPFFKRWYLAFRHLESQVSWASASLLIAFGLWWPFLLNPYFKTSILSYYLPILAQRLLTITWIGLIISGWVSTLLLPKKPVKYTSLGKMGVFMSWVFVPITALFFGALPAIDAQTHLLTGKYLGFWVTPKSLVKSR